MSNPKNNIPKPTYLTPAYEVRKALGIKHPAELYAILPGVFRSAITGNHLCCGCYYQPYRDQNACTDVHCLGGRAYRLSNCRLEPAPLEDLGKFPEEKKNANLLSCLVRANLNEQERLLRDRLMEEQKEVSWRPEEERSLEYVKTYMKIVRPDRAAKLFAEISETFAEIIREEAKQME